MTVRSPLVLYIQEKWVGKETEKKRKEGNVGSSLNKKGKTLNFFISPDYFFTYWHADGSNDHGNNLVSRPPNAFDDEIAKTLIESLKHSNIWRTRQKNRLGTPRLAHYGTDGMEDVSPIHQKDILYSTYRSACYGNRKQPLDDKMAYLVHVSKVWWIPYKAKSLAYTGDAADRLLLLAQIYNLSVSMSAWQGTMDAELHCIHKNGTATRMCLFLVSPLKYAIE